MGWNTILRNTGMLALGVLIGVGLTSLTAEAEDLRLVKFAAGETIRADDFNNNFELQERRIDQVSSQVLRISDAVWQTRRLNVSDDSAYRLVCPTGQRVLTGGCSSDATVPAISSFPNDVPRYGQHPTSWNCAFAPAPNTHNVEIFALCVDDPSQVP